MAKTEKVHENSVKVIERSHMSNCPYGLPIREFTDFRMKFQQRQNFAKLLSFSKYRKN